MNAYNDTAKGGGKRGGGGGKGYGGGKGKGKPARDAPAIWPGDSHMFRYVYDQDILPSASPGPLICTEWLTTGACQVHQTGKGCSGWHPQLRLEGKGDVQ